MFYRPFHAAEQRSKERISDSAERQRLSDVARSLRAAQGIRLWRTSGQLPFWFVLGKQNERKILKNNFLLYTWTSLCLSPAYPHSIAGTHKPSWWFKIYN